MKLVKRIIYTFSISIGIFLLVVLFQTVQPEQIYPSTIDQVFAKPLDPNKLSLDSLQNIVGDNKTTPTGFEKAALVAYSVYPELKNQTIEMVLRNTGAPMESNFDILSLFEKRENRLYQILLNDAENTGYDPILLRNLPFDAQVGILAHELGHTVYYTNLSTLELAKFGLMYLVSSDFRASHERSTDMMPVYHGLGHQIHHYAWFVRNSPQCKPLYEEFGKEIIDRYYMTDKELAHEIEQLEIYNK